MRMVLRNTRTCLLLRHAIMSQITYI